MIEDTEKFIRENDQIASSYSEMLICLRSYRNLSTEELAGKKKEASEEYQKILLGKVTWFNKSNLFGLLAFVGGWISLAALFSARNFDNQSFVFIIAGGIVPCLFYRKHIENRKRLEKTYLQDIRVIDMIATERGDKVAQQFRKIQYKDGELSY